MITTEEVFAGVRYQPLTEGSACGFLRVVRGPLDAASVRPDQILVLEQLPEEIPVSAAVISQPLQAPLRAYRGAVCGTKDAQHGTAWSAGKCRHRTARRKARRALGRTAGLALREISLAEAERRS
ncbi:MAG: hypothetical protein QM760_03570 [Nibricoccus sp.]